MARDEFRADHDSVSPDEIPVAELADPERGPAVTSARRRGPRIAAAGIAVALIVGGVTPAVAVNDANGAHRRVTSDRRADKTVDDDSARVDVFAALHTTTSSGSFKVRYSLTASRGPSGRDIAGEGVVNVDPIAMVTTAQVPGFGAITTRVDGTNVWEDGGANYGMTPSTNTGAGAPLSKFAGVVMSTVGPREGAVALNSLASPTGYLNFAQDAVTAASKVGDAVVDGVAVQEYAVTIDTMRALERPGLTAEEIATTTNALQVLRREGYTATTVRLSIDAGGFIRRAHSVVGFDDGGTVTGDTTFSDFGCSTVLMLANGPSIVAAPNGCRAAANPTPTSAP